MPEQQVSHPIFARFFDRFVGRDKDRGEAELRRELVAGLAGRVAEVGAGNGINFEHYPSAVDELIAIEPEPRLRRAAAEAAPGARVRTEVVDGMAAARRRRGSGSMAMSSSTADG